MNGSIRRKLEMAARVRTFSRAHTSNEATYATVLARLEELVTEAEVIAGRQHEANLAARGASSRRKELRRAVHANLLPYLVAVGNAAARDRTELTAQFRMPDSNTNNQAFLTAVKTLIATAEQQRDVLGVAGMAPALLEELRGMLAAFEVASEEARAKRLSRIGARADLHEIAGDLMEQVRLLDGINRWRFSKEPELMAEWQAARHLPSPKGSVELSETGGMASAA